MRGKRDVAGNGEEFSPVAGILLFFFLLVVRIRERTGSVFFSGQVSLLHRGFG